MANNRKNTTAMLAVVCVCALSHVWLFCNPKDCSPSGSSVHGIFQARILGWVAISSSRGSSQPRDRTWVFSATRKFFTIWATREASGLYTAPVPRREVQFSSVAQLCLTLCNPVDCSMAVFPVHHELPGLLKLLSIESVKPSNHLILCCPLILPPSIFPSIRVFSNESALHIRWPAYWSFSFSISPSNEYPGLISLG